MSRACLAALFLLATGPAADPPPAGKLDALKAAHKEAEAAFSKAAEQILDSADGRVKYQELYKAYDAAQAGRFGEAVAIAKADPKSDAALAALEWVLTIPRAYYLPPGAEAMALAAEHHAANPKVGKIIAWVGYYTPHPEPNPKENAAAMALIHAVADKNPDRTARAQAKLGQALAARKRFSRAEYTKSADVDQVADEAAALYDAIIKDYGDCRRLARPDSGTVGDFAREELIELRTLRIGKVAPDIEGTGVDGSAFKLSDSRGKVTVLVFWAKWCGPCMAMVPHERELVEKMKGKPFALIGVNGDDKLETAKETMAAEKMTWRSFWNGSGGPKGSITSAWNVRGWPTVYVLDAKGVIRVKGVREKELDAAVQELLKEHEKAK